MKVNFNFGKTEDPERAVLPTIIYCSASHPYFAGRPRGGIAIAVGWWAWNATVLLSWTKRPTTSEGSDTND